MSYVSRVWSATWSVHDQSRDTCVISHSHVWMWELDYKESWMLKNWCFWTVVLEKTFDSPLDFKEIQPVYPKGDQSWVFIGKTNAKAEIPVLWPPHVKSWLIGKDSDAGGIGGRSRRGHQRMKWLDGITDLMDMSLQCIFFFFFFGLLAFFSCFHFAQSVLKMLA